MSEKSEKSENDKQKDQIEQEQIVQERFESEIEKRFGGTPGGDDYDASTDSAPPRT